MREGARVSYVGHVGHALPGIGDTGKVVADAGTHGHVMWTTGARQGQVDLTPYDDLTVTPSGSQVVAGVQMQDTLAFGPMVATAVRETFDEQGPEGLLSALVEEGVLGGLVDVAETALVSVAHAIREDEMVRQALGQLDEAEGERFLAVTALALMKDAFGGGEVDD